MAEDWAEQKAREWIERQEAMISREEEVTGLAGLLREVGKSWFTAGNMRKAEAEHWADTLLAEVRRVVEEVRQEWEKTKPLHHLRTVEQSVCDEILSRLDKL